MDIFVTERINMQSKFLYIIHISTILFCLLLVFTPLKKARAARFSGEYLLKVCMLDENGNEKVKGGKIACQSYISAIIDYHNFLRSLDATGDKSFCIPESITLNQLQLIVMLYFIQNNKLHRKFVAAPGVEMALLLAFPCNKNNKRSER